MQEKTVHIGCFIYVSTPENNDDMVSKPFSCLIFALCCSREDPPTSSQPDSDDEAEEIQVGSKKMFCADT